MEGAANEEAALEGANQQPAPRGATNEELGGGSTEESSANGSRAPQGSANEQRGARRTPGGSATEGGGGLQGLANPDMGPEEPTNEAAGLQGTANRSRGPCTLTEVLQEAANESTACGASANQGTAGEAPTNKDTVHEASADQGAARRALTNENTAGEASANQGAGCGAAANKDTADKASTNKDTAGEAASNQGTGCGATANEDSSPTAPANEGAADGEASANEGGAPPGPAREGAGCRRSSTNGTPPGGAESPNEEAALLAPPSGARDPWDWSNEESWLRTPAEEGPEERWEELGEEWEGLAEGAWPAEEQAGPGMEGGDWWLSPDSAFSKRVLRQGRGLPRPGSGSLCRVLLQAPPLSPHWPAPGAGFGRWQTLRLGAAEGLWASLLDACLETMRGGERAWLKARGGEELGVWLGRFTPATPFWEAGPWRWQAAEALGGRAAELLRAGAVRAAAAAYGQALRVAVAAGGAPPLPPARAMPKAELHAGLALCQLRLGLPAAAAGNAQKALELRPQHLEARFRRALAAAAMRDLEAAAEDLREVLRAQPGHAEARRELGRVRGEARERDARLARRLGRLFA